MNDSVSRQIADLQRLSYKELKDLWRTLFGGDPPVYNKVFIRNRLAYRIQELSYGGLRERTRERMQILLIANGFDTNGCKPEGTRRNMGDNSDMPVIGTKLAREWNGTRREVTVVPGGFEYDGRRYRSLTAVTKRITGTHRNGRTFFGIKATKGSRSWENP